ncbi:MAG TPA: hypothetical protein VMT16_00450 [Thermoanaerobaculia bacterium]|nr:hypothetical protein [Thermoanaerobaculia bacterium]
MGRGVLIAGAVLVAGFTIITAATHAASKPPPLRFAAKDVDCGSIMSPAGEYAVALGKGDGLAPERRLVVKGVVVGSDGKPVQGVAVHLFPLGEKGPEGVLGMVDGKLTFANPRGTTDAAGRFTITTGPLWEFTDRVQLGLFVQRAPDRPFDVGVLAVENDAGALGLALSAKKRDFELGSITLAVPPAAP